MSHIRHVVRWGSPCTGWAGVTLDVVGGGVLGGLHPITTTSSSGSNVDFHACADGGQQLQQPHNIHHDNLHLQQDCQHRLHIGRGQACPWPSSSRAFSSTRAALINNEGCTQGHHPASDTSSSSSGRPAVEIQHLLLNAGLKHVSTYGWSITALEAAAKELGMSPAVVGILPRGESHLVEHFVQACNQQLEQQLSGGALSAPGLKTQEKLAMALRLRLSMLEPHINSWPQALAVLSRPTNLPHAVALLYQLVDDVWTAAGDTSTDASWYTKRAALAGVYTSTELYMLTDFSSGFEDTWQALNRRLEDAVVLGRLGAGMQAAWQQVLKQTAADLGLKQHKAAGTEKKGTL